MHGHVPQHDPPETDRRHDAASSRDQASGSNRPRDGRLSRRQRQAGGFHHRRSQHRRAALRLPRENDRRRFVQDRPDSDSAALQIDRQPRGEREPFALTPAALVGVSGISLSLFDDDKGQISRTLSFDCGDLLPDKEMGEFSISGFGPLTGDTIWNADRRLQFTPPSSWKRATSCAPNSVGIFQLADTTRTWRHDWIGTNETEHEEWHPDRLLGRADLANWSRASGDTQATLRDTPGSNSRYFGWTGLWTLIKLEQHFQTCAVVTDSTSPRYKEALGCVY